MSRAGTVGVIANPAAGKDIRRLVSAASPTSDMAKVGIVRRTIIGAVEGGASQVLVADDHKALGRAAIDGLDRELRAPVEVVDGEVTPSPAHTRTMTARLRDLAVDALIVLGGDGTHRDVAKAWRDVPLVAVSTGTNNVFPAMIEATIAGHAAAIAAAGVVRLASIATQAKVLDVAGERGADLALVDVALVDGRFTASRAVWDTGTLRELIVTTAERHTIGLSSIAAAVDPVDRDEPGGVHVVFGAGERVRAPIAPGLYADVSVASARRLLPGGTATLCGAGVVSFDGERDLVLRAGERLDVTVRHDGPWVIDPVRAMRAGRETR